MITRLADLSYRLYDRMRHREAFEVANEPGTAEGFEALEGRHYCLLVTFKRSGEAVPTPVLFGLADGKLYFRTEERVGKVRRIRSDPHVRVGPCNMRGKPRGPLTEATARILPPQEAATARAALAANWTKPMGVFERTGERMPLELVYIEVLPVGTGA